MERYARIIDGGIASVRLAKDANHAIVIPSSIQLPVYEDGKIVEGSEMWMKYQKNLDRNIHKTKKQKVHELVRRGKKATSLGKDFYKSVVTPNNNN